jgi:hypothetical protein
MRKFIIALGLLIASANAQELCLEHGHMPNCADLSTDALKMANNAKTSGEDVYSISAGRTALLKRYAKSCETLEHLMKRIEETTEPFDCHIIAYANFLDKCSATGWSYGECAMFWDKADQKREAEALDGNLHIDTNI